MNINQVISDRLLQLMDTVPLKSDITRRTVGKTIYGPFIDVGFKFEFQWKIDRFRRLRASGIIYDSGQESVHFSTRNIFGWNEIDKEFYNADTVEVKAYKLALQVVADSKSSSAKEVLKSLS